MSPFIWETAGIQTETASEGLLCVLWHSFLLSAVCAVYGKGGSGAYGSF